MPLGDSVNLQQIAEQTENCTGADLENLCREAALLSLRENVKATQTVKATEVVS
jgi:transitional endoplasmic reticulum ATPase